MKSERKRRGKMGELEVGRKEKENKKREGDLEGEMVPVARVVEMQVVDRAAFREGKGEMEEKWEEELKEEKGEEEKRERDGEGRRGEGKRWRRRRRNGTCGSTGENTYCGQDGGGGKHENR